MKLRLTLKESLMKYMRMKHIYIYKRIVTTIRKGITRAIATSHTVATLH